MTNLSRLFAMTSLDDERSDGITVIDSPFWFDSSTVTVTFRGGFGMSFKENTVLHK